MDKFKFAHLADVHLGAWREKNMKYLNRKHFSIIMEEIIKDKDIRFVLISGDLFHISQPDIEDIKLATKYFRKLKEEGKGVYVVPGSHDFSVDEKTFLSVLEEAGLCINTAKVEGNNDKIILIPTIDKSTGTIIYGMIGRRNGLEIEYYSRIKELKDIDKYKDSYVIFQMHSGVEEFLPPHLKEVKSLPSHLIPNRVNYYASGHIHYPAIKKLYQGTFVFPGPTFASSYSEIEMLKEGSYVVVEAYKNNGIWEEKIELRKVKVKEVITGKVNVDQLAFNEAQEKIIEWIKNNNIEDKIALLKVEGELSTGNISDIDMKTIKEKAKEKNPYIFKMNTSKLYSKEFEEIKEEVEGKSIEEIENQTVKNHLNQQNTNFDEEEMVKKLMHILAEEKGEEEGKEDYNTRVNKKAKRMLLDILRIEERIQEE